MSFTRAVTRSVMVKHQVALLYEDNTVSLSPFLQHRGTRDSTTHSGQANSAIHPASRSAPARIHLQATSPDGVPFILGERPGLCAPSWGADMRPRGWFIADDSSPSREAAQSPLASPSNPSLWRKCVVPAETQQHSRWWAEWTRPNEGDTFYYRIKKMREVIKTKISTFSRSSLWPSVSAGVAVRYGGGCADVGPGRACSHPRQRPMEPVDLPGWRGAEARTSAAGTASCRGGRAASGTRFRCPSGLGRRLGLVGDRFD